MGLRAAFFDVGDTLVEDWTPNDGYRVLARQAIVDAFGERPWLDAFCEASHERLDPEEPTRQETIRWYADWFRENGIECDIDLDVLRSTWAVPLDLVSTPAPGGQEAVRWCKARGLRVVLVTNTLARGDAEVLRDWSRAGLADAIDAVVSSHDVGWRKPHPAMYERALALAGVDPAEAFMVGDNFDADVRGAKRLGLRAIWRRLDGVEPPADVRPDAVVRTLHELPGVVEPWL
jgi:HAD superfamily hydrolase (TIGR01662 family)